MIEYWLACLHLGFMAGFAVRQGWLAVLFAGIMIAGAGALLATILVIEQMTMQRSLLAEIIGSSLGLLLGLYVGGNFND